MNSRTSTPALYAVAVRALCEFTAKQGDLDLRFTPSATALEGITGHQTVAARRGAGYEAEIALEGICDQLLLRGRADGYDPASNRLDEVKTFRGDLDAMPANRRHLHWAQAKIYGALLCRARGLKQLDIALVYFDVGSQTETMLVEPHSAEALEQFLLEHCRRFADWAARQLEHREARNAALAAVRFPHAGFRTGQRELSEAVYKAAVNGRCLLAQAPTGIGKTVGTLFPMLKAWPVRGLDKLFFLTAKTPGRALALQALQAIARSSPALPLRVLELVARDKACEHPGKACHGEACPLARGFYDRLPAARDAALAKRTLDRVSLRQAALEHDVCPYYLGQELVRWADVVVGDYNHYFDLNALLHGLTLTDGWRVALLVDEAHNLVDRGRAMYTAELRWSDLQALLATKPGRGIGASLGRLQRCWDALATAQATPYAVHDELPNGLLASLQNFSQLMSEVLATPTEPRAEPDPALLRFYFDVLVFLRLHESFGEHSLIDLTVGGDSDGDSIWCLRNVVPAPFLKPRVALAQTSTLFSATLQPGSYYRDLLGLPESTAAVDVASPFAAEQLQVRVATAISTRWGEREASVEPIVDLIARQFAQAPGNYLAFFSSFDYLQQIADRLAASHPAVPQWRQSRAMTEAARTQFLDRFTADSQGIGFAVLGGAFAEGIDLPGRRLIGAFVATLGLPQWNPVNEQIRQRMDVNFGTDRGHDYTYLYPGLQKVVQAAGRVIRTTDDRGVVWLIDDRYARAKVRRLLPQWWRSG
ncbi:ATP-dependent DNA helicase [Piscinibacter sakaiensis]|uniref:ATP-dependent DNA helicase n=1 Tax=Piscinibacter sakaiensis TaxID=1547922 RepID=UPI003AACE6FE